jgi:phosphatidate cytidylyltransferase
MLLRILSAVVLIPLVVALVWWGPAYLVAAVAGLVTLGAVVEFLSLGERVGLRAFRKWTLVCAGGLFYAQYSASFVESRALGSGFSLVRSAASGYVSIDVILLVFLFGSVCIGLAMRRPLHEIMAAISVSSAGLLFIALPFSYLVRLDEVEGVGRQLLLFTLCLIWAGDTVAYFVGRFVGRVPLAAVLSPKKTWEGAFANFVASLIVGVVFGQWTEANTMTIVIIAGLANIAGQMGDLIESAYKRGASVKDSGSIVPGHGGILDRVDSLILAGPVVWLAYQWLVVR